MPGGAKGDRTRDPYHVAVPVAISVHGERARHESHNSLDFHKKGSIAVEMAWLSQCDESGQ